MTDQLEPGTAQYDCIIAGGGLAGLSLSILLAGQGRRILVLEKNYYPFHKVCGEYVSMESYEFLKRLGLPLGAWSLPGIDRVSLTTAEGMAVTEKLHLGGFGISRFTLDSELAKIAKDRKVDLREGVKVVSYEYQNDLFSVHTNIGLFTGLVLCASFGKHPPGNFHKPGKSIENWVGVKYHIRYSFPGDLIALHHFNGGYGGISRVENDQCCLCYLVKASQLKRYGSIPLLEEKVLSENENLAKIFKEADFMGRQPVTVSNVTFNLRKPVSNHVFYLGDSAGCIAPLSGNGMSMAMRASWLLSAELNAFFDGRQSLKAVEANYRALWYKHFRWRILFGQYLQFLFCKPLLTRLFVWLLARLPFLRRKVISNTHGLPF